MKVNVANFKINYILKISNFTYMIVGPQLTFSAWELDLRAMQIPMKRVAQCSASAKAATSITRTETEKNAEHLQAVLYIHTVHLNLQNLCVLMDPLAQKAQKRKVTEG